MKKTLVKAALEAARRSARESIQHAAQLEIDLANRKGWTEREQALFLQIDATNAIDALQTAIRALEGIRNDVRAVLDTTAPPALCPVPRNTQDAMALGTAIHLEMERSLQEAPVFAEARGGGWFWWLPHRLPPEDRGGGRVPSQANGPFASHEEARTDFTISNKR